MKIRVLLLTTLVCITSSSLSATSLKIPGSSSVSTLPTELLHEVVERSDRYTRVEYVYGDQGDASFSRTQEDVNQGKLDLMWTATSKTYEEQFTAVYFPIYKGSLGIRIGIIKQENRHLFENIRTESELKSLTACQGKLWADTPILQANGVDVAASHKYFNLFPMLEGERCHYFPRAFFEPWGEIEREKEYKLIVDEHMLIRYKLANLFFVKKGNHELAQHLYQILLEMHGDGQFEAMFKADPDVQRGLSYAKLSNRRVFEFNNPYITEEVRNIPEELWLDLEDRTLSVAN